ncbi:MAG: FtsK/SpoIIIE domain-containing protein [Chloroflexota bacterium]
MNLKEWQTVIQEQKVPHQIKVQSRQVETAFSQHNVDAQILGGGINRETIRFDLSEQVEAGKELLSGIKKDLLSIFGVSSIQFARQKGQLQLQIDRPQNSPVPLIELLTSIDEISPQTAVLGLDEEGHPLLHEFMPQLMSHVLIQGMKGAGKSALLKTIAISLAMLNKQSKLQLLAVSPASNFSNDLLPLNYLPHMLEPVMESSEDCGQLFTFLEEELQYRLSQNCATPTIITLIDNVEALTASPQIINQLHYLLQNGPNAGIYFVLAHEVGDNHMPEMIKANIPLQIVGKVNSSDDAQRITGLVDSQAEHLNGKGEFLTLSGEMVIYFHSAFVNDHELLMVIDKLHRNRPRPILAQSFSNSSYSLPDKENGTQNKDDFSFTIRDQQVELTPIPDLPQQKPVQPLPIRPSIVIPLPKPEAVEEIVVVKPIERNETIEVVEENQTTPEWEIGNQKPDVEHKPLVVKKPVVKLFDKEKKAHLDKNEDELIPFDLGAPPDDI